MGNTPDKKSDISSDMDEITKNLNEANEALAAPYVTNAELASLQRAVSGVPDGNFLQSFGKTISKLVVKEESTDDKHYRLQILEAIRVIREIDNPQEKYKNVDVLLKKFQSDTAGKSKSQINPIDAMVIEKLEKITKMAQDRAEKFQAQVTPKQK